MSKPKSDPNFIILYVADPTASAAFYRDLLGRPPVEASPTFAMFALDSGVMFGLWARHTVAPPATAESGARGEIAFSIKGRAAVDATHVDWTRRGLKMLQAPTDLDFGRSFVASDPDGHRLRVFAPAAP